MDLIIRKHENNENYVFMASKEQDNEFRIMKSREI